MNAASWALLQGALSRAQFREWLFSLQGLLVIMLLLISLGSAFGVIYVKDLDRRLFSELQGLQHTHDELQVEWGQLVLEQNTWSTAARIQQFAKTNLGMEAPPSHSIVMVKK